MTKRRIVVLGFMAACPISGVVWQHLHYIIGLQRLGHDVFYVEDSARYPFDAEFNVTKDCSFAVATLWNLARSFGFQDRWVYCARFLDPPSCFGQSLQELRQLYREADAVLNVCGAHELHEDLLTCERLIYVESDPGLEQIKIDQGDENARAYLQHHQKLFTFGENIGSSTFPVPLHGLEWLPTRQPVVTDYWKTDSSPSNDAIFTTIANWSTRGKKDVTWNNETYLWSKSENFLTFIDAPAFSRETFEIAADIRDLSTAERFRKKGWRLSDPYALSSNQKSYQTYIKNSYGEFTIAKDQYVRLNTGWFSDRSACYLAAGRPVITQQTGFTQLYGGEKGLYAFSDIDHIRLAAAEIRVDYPTHSKAAFEIAREFFEAEKVLASLLDRAGI